MSTARPSKQQAPGGSSTHRVVSSSHRGGGFTYCGSETARPSSSSLLSPRSRGPVSHVHRSGGAGVISQDEAASVLKHVARRCSAIEDEAELAYLSRQLALQDKEREKAKKARAEKARKEQDERDAATARASQESTARSSTSTSTSPSSSRPAGILAGAKSAILEHGFSIGGEDDGLTLGSDSGGGGEGLRFNGPSCIAALPDGELCVADTQNHRLVILTPEGQPRAFLHGGEGRDALRLPRGIAADATALFVTEIGGSRMRKLRLPEEFRVAGAETPRGSHLGGMSLDATHGTSAGALTFPQGITYDAGELFVCDCEEHTIFVYDALTLQFKRSFGGPGDAEGELSFPYACVVVGREVIVADVGNHRLSSFSRLSGAFIRCIGSEGESPGQFRGPRGVAVLLTEPRGGSAGASAADKGSGEPALDSAEADPSALSGSGIFVDDELVMLSKDAKLVVCEQKRVQILSLAGAPLQVVVPSHPELEGGPESDLWAICTAGNFTYVTDKGRSCIHVLLPPRTVPDAWTPRGPTPRRESFRCEGHVSDGVTGSKAAKLREPTSPRGHEGAPRRLGTPSRPVGVAPLNLPPPQALPPSSGLGGGSLGGISAQKCPSARKSARKQRGSGDHDLDEIESDLNSTLADMSRMQLSCMQHLKAEREVSMAEGVPAVLLGGRAKLADPSQLTELQLFQLKKELELDADRASGLTSAGGERSGAEPFPLPPDSGPRGMVLRERETALKMRISPLSVKCGGPGSGGGGGGAADAAQRRLAAAAEARAEARAEVRGKGFDTASGGGGSAASDGGRSGSPPCSNRSPATSRGTPPTSRSSIGGVFGKRLEPTREQLERRDVEAALGGGSIEKSAPESHRRCSSGMRLNAVNTAALSEAVRRAGGSPPNSTTPAAQKALAAATFAASMASSQLAPANSDQIVPGGVAVLGAPSGTAASLTSSSSGGSSPLKLPRGSISIKLGGKAKLSGGRGKAAGGAASSLGQLMSPRGTGSDTCEQRV